MKNHLLLILVTLCITTSLCQAQDATLWGLTQDGGANGTNAGTIFSYDLVTDIETDQHDFGSGTDGFGPLGSLIQARNGLLYGMTDQGGTRNDGIIFSYNISTGAETKLYDFGGGLDGRKALGSLIQASNGLLYGMTWNGGTTDSGIIFSYDISTGTETKLHDFGATIDGGNPGGSLIQASNGLLYGTTFDGGTNNNGTIFSYSISTGIESVIHDFGNGTDGRNPQGSLLHASNGLLYGTASLGGTENVGIIFSYDISTGTETDVHDFRGVSGGYQPLGSLIQDSNGLLYGMTFQGGANSEGSIFSFDISTDTENTLHNFGGGTDGWLTAGSFVQASNGLLYASAALGGIYSSGAIISYNISADAENDIYSFGNGTDGQNPISDLIEVDNGGVPSAPLWPGDANEDLKVDNYDLLPIGLYYGETGPARDTVTNSWAPHPASNWSSSQSDGYNKKYVDCNGDGTINSDDTLAVTLNYGLTHLLNSPPRADAGASGVPLYFTADSSLYHAGSKVHVSVWLGNSTAQATNLYALGYDIEMDMAPIQPGTLVFKYNNSFIGTKNSDVLTLTHIGNGVETAVTRIDHHNKSGYGKIGDLYFTLSPSITFPQFLISVSSSLAVDSAGNSLMLQPENDTLNIKIPTGINQLSGSRNNVLIYPNPSSTSIHISLKLQQEQPVVLSLFNTLGQQVWGKDLGETNQVETTIPVTNLANGVYVLKVNSGGESEQKEVVVEK